MRRRIPADTVCQSCCVLGKQLRHLWSSVWLHGVYWSAAVFVPQVNGFAHNGVCVFLRYLEGESCCEALKRHLWRQKQCISFLWAIRALCCYLLTLHRNLTTPSGRLMPINTILLLSRISRATNTRILQEPLITLSHTLKKKLQFQACSLQTTTPLLYSSFTYIFIH